MSKSKATKRKMSNPLALAVMGTLLQRPMHPYEIAATMRAHAVEQSVKLNYGSLYTVVEALERAGFIVPQETVREGRRPERTVYALTETGRAELFRWLRDLVRRPVKEYPHFAAGLAFLAALPRSEVVALFEERGRFLAAEVAATRATLDELMAAGPGQPGLPRLVLLEVEYQLRLREAERAWVRQLVREIRDGTLPWPVFELRDGRVVWSFPDQAPTSTGTAAPVDQATGGTATAVTG